jgi:hypothetical protein
MATTFNFNGQTIIIPGSYSSIKSGMKNPPIELSFGNILIIDTGSGAGYGGGAGVAGELTQGKDSIYNFDNISDFRDFAKGGLWWLLAQPLFRPAGLGVNGVSKISYIKAASTVAARMSFHFVDADISVSRSTFSEFLIAVTDEGLIGNGTLVSGNLTKGFAAKLSAGTIDPSLFVLTFYRGTYKGLDQNGLPFDGITEANSIPLVVAKSPEFSTAAELAAWMKIDYLFNKHFKLVSDPVIIGTGELAAADIINYGSYNLASGGTESYVSTQYLTDVLTAVTDLDINFIFADQYGANAQSAQNYEILSHIVETSKFKPELYVAAGDDINTFESLSLPTCVYYNNDSVTVVHGAIKKQSQQGMRIYNAMYHAAAVLGKEAGQEPQVPITFKTLDFDGMTHSLNDKEITKALKAGLVTTRLEGNSFDITKGVNSLQENTFLVNDNGTTHSKQMKRIARQLNKEIIVESKRTLLKDPNGVNRNTLSEVDVKAWLIGYLKSKTATIDNDNLILSFQDIVVTRQQDGYFINYKFVPNSEISFLFFTGLIIGV